MTSSPLTLTVLFNDTTDDPRLTAAHGFSCLIEGLEQTILFDTGGDGHILLENMANLDKNPAAVDIVVVSHAHWDHSGGLFTFLRRARGGIQAYFTKSVAKDFRDHAAFLGAKVHVVDEEPVEILPGVTSTGQMGGEKLPIERREQSLVLDTADGTVVLTGCAHPNVVEIVRKARALRPGAIDLVLGGFHLKDSDSDAAAATIRELKGLGVRRMGASHCTGEQHMDAFREAWSGQTLSFGCGARVRLVAPVEA